MNQAQGPKPEFSRPLVVDALEPETTIQEISADTGERHRLVERFQVVALDDLHATLRITPSADGSVRITGDMVAEVIQSCVVTLEPVRSSIERSFEWLFVPWRDEVHPGDEIELGGGEADFAEPIVDGIIDLGEALAEQMALELDPFPHAPGAEFEAFSTDSKREDRNDGGEEEPPHPFAKLAELKRNL